MNNAPIDGELALSLDNRLSAEIAKFYVKSGDNHLSLTGSLNDVWDVEGDIKLVDPQSIDGRLKGSGLGQFAVKGKASAPKINWDLDLQNLGFKDTTIATFSSQGSIDIAQQYLGAINLNAIDISVQDIEIDTFKLTAKGDIKDHQALVKVNSSQLDVNADFNGGLSEPSQYLLSLDKVQLSNELVALTNVDEINLNYGFDKQAAVVSAHCWKGKNTQFCVDESVFSQNKGEFGLVVSRFDLSVLSLFLPETISPSGHLVGKLIAKWQDGAITQIDSNVSSQEVNFVIDESFIKTNI